MTLVHGLDIGGTKIAGGLVTPSGDVVATASVPTPADDGPRAIIAAAAGLCRRLAADAPRGETITGIGIGAAGVIDPVGRRVLAATSSLREWAGTDLGADLEAATGLPVSCDNDVRAHAVGEAWLGAGRGAESMLLVAAGTGIGGALVTGGRPLIGAHAASGHFGHIPVPEAAGLPCTCGREGHLEVISSGPAVLDAYVRTAGNDPAVRSARDVAVLAMGGERTAAGVVTTAATALGRAIAGVVNSLDPSLVVVTGGLSGAGDAWWTPLRAAYERDLMDIVRDCPLRPATLGGNAAIVGAAKLALNERKN